MRSSYTSGGGIGKLSSTNRKTIEKNVQLARDLEIKFVRESSHWHDHTLRERARNKNKQSMKLGVLDHDTATALLQLYSFFPSAPWSTNISISRHQIIARANL